MSKASVIWQARAAACELLALSFRYPKDRVLVDAVTSGEWNEAACEIAEVLGLEWPDGADDGVCVAGAGADADADVGGADSAAGWNAAGHGVAGAAGAVAIVGADAGGADSAASRDATDRGAAGTAGAASLDPAELLHDLRTEATRLFVGAPEPAVSPYEGVWRAADDGVQALLFVNPHSMEVERFCRACGLGRPGGTNEPLDAAWTELELLEYLALRAAADADELEGASEPREASAADAPGKSGEPGEPDACSEPGEPDEPCERGDSDAPCGVVTSDALPGGSPEAAWNQFVAEHAKVWMGRFAEAVQEKSRVLFYRQAASLLKAFIG